MQPQQQQQENFGVVRRPLDIEDYIDIVRRHRGWILGPMFASLVLSVVGAYLWPDTYRSSASLRVQSPVMPENLMQSPVSSTLNDRINSMASGIKSRTVLQTIETEHGPIQVVGSGFRLEHGGGSVDRPPAKLGQHTDEVLGEAGYSAAEIAEMHKQAIV